MLNTIPSVEPSTPSLSSKYDHYDLLNQMLSTASTAPQDPDRLVPMRAVLKVCQHRRRP